MKNKFEIRGDITIIFLNTNKGIYETKISTSKLAKAQEYPNTWRVHWGKYGKHYVDGKVGKETYFLHRFLTDAPDDMVVDHLDGDPFNNLDDNLVPKTHQVNLFNRKGANKNNTLGIRGVSKSGSRYRARVSVNGKSEYLGTFDTEAEAGKVVLEFWEGIKNSVA